jgi:hypothetical protein
MSRAADVYQYDDVTPEKENTLAQTAVDSAVKRVIMRLSLKSAILIHGYRYIPFL